MTSPEKRHAAFLRGINLGKRRLKNDELRRHFEELGLEEVATFLASGNVIFDHAGSDLADLERRIERHLHEALGFATETFVRPFTALARLVALDLVDDARAEGFTPHVIFLRSRPGDDAMEALRGLESPDDVFHPLESELLYLRRGRLSDSAIETRHLEKALGGAENTMRNLNTIERIVERFGA